MAGGDRGAGFDPPHHPFRATPPTLPQPGPRPEDGDQRPEDGDSRGLRMGTRR